MREEKEEKAGCLCALISSRVALRMSGEPSPWLRWVSPQNAQGISRNDGAGSRVSVSVGRGATVGSPALTQAQGPRQSHRVGPVQSHWPHSQKHLPAQAPCPEPGGAEGGQAAQGFGGLALCPVTCRLVSRAWAAPGPSPPMDTEGLDLFLRQSCILILDVLPGAYFS
ncbi:unnamed protein product [Pipistrellus nathusii]|uniref:Uncharacterized protein n=1 Tax=Pipistrellus nathusii TaxID=59473 RepID=A0ABN9ZD77_PIPNA